MKSVHQGELLSGKVIQGYIRKCDWLTRGKRISQPLFIKCSQLLKSNVNATFKCPLMNTFLRRLKTAIDLLAYFFLPKLVIAFKWKKNSSVTNCNRVEELFTFALVAYLSLNQTTNSSLSIARYSVCTIICNDWLGATKDLRLLYNLSSSLPIYCCHSHFTPMSCSSSATPYRHHSYKPVSHRLRFPLAFHITFFWENYSPLSPKHSAGTFYTTVLVLAFFLVQICLLKFCQKWFTIINSICCM